jgi:hypothetical protein
MLGRSLRTKDMGTVGRADVELMLNVSDLTFGLVTTAPPPYMGVINSLDAGLSIEKAGCLPARKCRKCGWIGTSPEIPTKRLCLSCSCGDSMSERTPQTQRRTAWYELYQIVAGTQQTVRNKVRDALAMAELWMVQKDIVLISSKKAVALWNDQRTGDQKKLTDEDFNNVYKMIASERGSKFLGTVTESIEGWDMALKKEQGIEDAAEREDKRLRRKLYKFAELLDFESAIPEFVYVGVDSDKFPLYQQYGFGAGEDDLLRAAGRYDSMGEYCGIPKPQGPRTAPKTTILQLNLRMMVDDGMIWYQSKATKDGQTVFMTRGCDGGIAPYYIERAFLNGVTIADVHSCGRDRKSAFGTWVRIQSQGTCKHLKAFTGEASAALRHKAEKQIMYYVENLIQFPSKDEGLLKSYWDRIRPTRAQEAVDEEEVKIELMKFWDKYIRAMVRF